MRFIKTYWLEMLMVIPLFAYIIGFTLLPILTNIKASFIDQRFGRRSDILASKIADITYDLEHAADSEEKTVYEQELADATLALERLRQSPYAGWSLSNYHKLFTDRSFLQAIFNTLAITLLGLSLQAVLAMAIALVLTRPLHGKSVFRTVVLTPLGIPTIVSATIMTYIFDTAGYLNAILYRLGLLAEAPIDWAQGGWLSIAMVVFADTWKVLPLMVLLFIAGLEAIPRSVHEASQIDGSPPLYKFFTVTLPLMKPYITIALILRAIDAFRIFELPLILAGTETTPLISTFTYSEYARQNYNLSAASGTILTGLILLFVFTYLYIVEREREPHA
ncbi:MAG TPA: sugar ABC transporter permease [Candidatus Tectomicrobia bacterium]|nr:sugar ABC transporter permease [Candidatus Tectomicrobia bacterium]